MRLIVGAYLTQSYAYEAAAITNPSMVPVGPASSGAQEFVMSARAIGEGHVSSIAFVTDDASSTSVGCRPASEQPVMLRTLSMPD